jgi:hypothetical protein
LFALYRRVKISFDASLDTHGPAARNCGRVNAPTMR